MCAVCVDYKQSVHQVSPEDSKLGEQEKCDLKKYEPACQRK